MSATIVHEPAIDAGVSAPPPAVRTALCDIGALSAALVPFGLALGSASAAAGLSGFEAVFGALIMLAGAGQLAAVEAIGRGESVVAIALVVALVNMRFVFYGAAAAGWFAGAGRWRRLLLVYPIVDQTFMLCQQRFEIVTDLAWRQRYYATATAMLGGSFVASQVVAFHLGTAMPASAGFHLMAPLVFTGMLATATRQQPQVVAAIVGAVVVTLGASVLGPLALPVAVAAGVLVASRSAVSS